MNHLDPSIKKSPWTRDEDNTIRSMHDQLGSQWSQYVPFLPGRGDNAIKNRYHMLSKHALAYEASSFSEPSSKRSRSTKSTDSGSDITLLPPRITKRAKKIEILYAMRRRIELEISQIQCSSSYSLLSLPLLPSLPPPSHRTNSCETDNASESTNLDSFDFDFSTLNEVLESEEHVLWDKWFQT
eukprot:GDKK01006479.1.p1 GENE.GDKK01006479.1~~GDKK01006479.1.p1  ORF type:complete len:214 (+),score=29.14 GDKK01006479.1:93-644(+)